MFAKGKICYYFKGMQMSSDRCSVRQQTDTDLVVLRDNDEQIFEFVRRGKNWLLKNHSEKNDALYGSCFIKDNE